MANLKTNIVINLLGDAQTKLKAFSEALTNLTKLQDKLKRSTAFANKAANAAKKATEDLTKATKKDTEETRRNKESKDKQRNSLQNLASSLVQVGAGLGLKHELTEIMSTASMFEQKKLDLSTVLGVDMASTKLKEFTREFEKLASSGISSYEEISDTGYALKSAGLSDKEALKGTKAALEVAAITKGHGEEVANIMATVSKDFRMPIERVGDILAKTQVKFQIKNFQQLEDGLKYVAASAATLNIPLSQTATIIGTLNDAGQMGTMAGTGFSNILNSMQKVSSELNIRIPKAKDGSLDVIGWTKAVSSKVKDVVGPDVTMQQYALTKLFGSEGARSFLILQGRAHELAEGFKDVSENSKGFTKQQIQKYYSSYTYQVKAFHNSLEMLSASIGETMIPMFNRLIKTVKPYITEAMHWVGVNQDLTQKIFMLAGAFATLTIVAGGLFVLKTVFSPIIALASAVLWLTKVLRIGRLVMIAFRITAFALRLAVLGLNIAFYANPIGAIIGLVVLLGIAAYQLIKHWKKVKEFFVSLWGAIKNGAETLFNWLSKPLETISNLWDKIKGLWGSQDLNIKKTDTNIVKQMNNNSSPNSSYQGVPSNTNNITHHNSINIHGITNPKEVAEAVSNHLSEQQQLSMAH